MEEASGGNTIFKVHAARKRMTVSCGVSGVDFVAMHVFELTSDRASDCAGACTLL